MERPEDIEWCCGAICDSTNKLAYIEHLEARVKELEKQLETETNETV